MYQLYNKMKNFTASLPESYSTTSFEDIAVTHVLVNSKTPTLVILITLNRPEAFNAATETMLQELEQVYAWLNLDNRVSAIVMTGAGKAFCAGVDIDIGFSKMKEEKLSNASIGDWRDGGGRVDLAIHNCCKPTIMAVNGPAVGFGITISLPAAIRVACASTKISFVFSRRALVMESASAHFLPRLIGYSRAVHLTTTGSIYAASDPLLRELFSEVLVTSEATVARALALATDIAVNTSNVSTKLMRDMMYRGPPTPEAAHILDSNLFISMVGSRDNEEGMQSFVQRREPVFTGTIGENAPAVWPWWHTINTAPEVKTENKRPKL